MNSPAKKPTEERDAMRGKVVALEGFIRDSGLAIDHEECCPVTHHFAPGLYAREIWLPKGVIVVGKIHKHSHINTISVGEVVVATEFGLSRLKGPHTFISEAGAKRAVVALSDTIWTTYHVTEETDVEKIEEEIIAKSYADLVSLEDFKHLTDLLEDLP